MSDPDAAIEVRRQLQAIARDSGENFQRLLERYALERFLHRLGSSPYAPSLALKGAVLFSAWLAAPHRPTRDVDFASTGDHDASDAAEMITTICTFAVDDDGVTFDTADMKVETIRERDSKPGTRATFTARIATARVRLQVDISFDDAISPAPRPIDIESLINLPSFSVLAYSPATVIAEKLQIIIELGRFNSRMKDYFDLHELATRFELSGPELVHAINQTCKRRSTSIPADVPDGLSNEFASDTEKKQQWHAFLERIEHPNELTLPDCITRIRELAQPALKAAAGNAPVPREWTPTWGWY